MTIKQQGGIFGRNPSFNDVTATNTTTTDLSVTDGDITLSKSGTTSGLITQGAVSEGANRMALGNGDTGVWFLDNLESIVPFNPAAGTSRGSAINLGYSSIPFANLYLSGNVKVGDGSGIDFSATSGTGTSELFDDYEEGTWTASYGGATTDGYYTKIGRFVVCDITLNVNGLSFTGLTGLPFTSATAGYTGCFWGRTLRADALDANGVPCRAIVTGTSVNFYTNVAGGADGAFTVTTDASGAVRAGLTIFYYV